MIFQNRKHAGELLASRLSKFKNKNSIVLALPRGGVPLAAEIAKALNAPLDVLIVRKIGAPFNAELAAGAICENDEPVFNSQVLGKTGIDPDNMKDAVIVEKNEIQRQIKEFRHGKVMVDINKKIVIIVDDGLATGSTVKAAIKYLKKKGASKIVVAVPVAPSSTARVIRDKVDELVVLEEHENLVSVGQWYQDFSQVSDKEVIRLLQPGSKQSSVMHSRMVEIKPVEIKIDKVRLEGELTEFPDMKAIIIFAHGSGSSRKSLRNLQVARDLNVAGFGTLLFDLLTDYEAKDRRNVFNIEFLGERLVLATDWLRQQHTSENIKIGYFGASTGAAAALLATAKQSVKDSIYSVVSRGGRPDLAEKFLESVQVPTLLIVGSHDKDVLELNRKAQKQLVDSKLSIVNGATHLFEEPGTLEEVSRQAMQWFNSCLAQKAVKKNTEAMPRSAFEKKAESGLLQDRDLEDAINEAMIKINKEDDLDALIESVKDARVVMLGEATHGTLEYYRLRALISKKLIKNHGFKFIAVEGDWPAAYRVNKYIQTGEGENARSVLLKNHRWPTWMWANEEIVKLAEWMKNKGAGFYGLDVYSLFESIDEVNKYLRKNYPVLAQVVEQRYACFDPFERDEIAYARSLIKYPIGCERAVLLNLQKLLRLRIKDVSDNGDELFNAKQNAHTIANAETYYRSMLNADAGSWNIRDAHMMETLDRLLGRAGEGAKAIVWAHNTHIGDYRATDMKDDGYVNLGGLARLSYGDENVALVGFGSYQGEVLAGSAWGGPEKIMTLPPARSESYESYFHKVAVKHRANQFYLIMKENANSALTQKLGHRAIGVVYNPAHESRGNYVPTELAKRYNSFIFVDKTHALKSLHSAFIQGELPETWPSGL